MKRFHALTFLVTVTIIAWSCAPSLKVNSDYDKAVNFSTYKTFTLYNPENVNKAISDLNRTRVINAIKSEMAKKGFVENATNPDLLVNAVAIFEEDTPRELISKVQPDVLVKGGDYNPDKIAGADIVKAKGGSVISIPFVEGYSTTSIESKIKASK